MSLDKHKPLSDALRRALQGLDASPSDLLTKATTRGLSVTKQPTLRQLNARVLQTKAMTRKEREEEAQRLAIERRPKYPDARVLFVEHTLCTSCSFESEGVSHPLIFLRLRAMDGSRFDPTSITYVPEKEYVDFPGARLPRLIEHHTTKVSSCPKCFTNAVHSFRGERIGSSAQGVREMESAQGITGETPSSSSSTSASSPSSTEIGERSGTPISLARDMKENTSCGELSSDLISSASVPPPAPAQPISSLIVEERENARGLTSAELHHLTKEA
jgi:hypothetical protein